MIGHALQPLGRPHIIRWHGRDRATVEIDGAIVADLTLPAGDFPTLDIPDAVLAGPEGGRVFSSLLWALEERSYGALAARSSLIAGHGPEPCADSDALVAIRPAGGPTR